MPYLTLDHLTVDFSEDADGVLTLDALASTRADRHAAVLAQAHGLLAWAAQALGTAPGPLAHGEDGSDGGGHDWDHDLQVVVADGGWHEVSLTLAVTSPRAGEFMAAFVTAFPDSVDDRPG